MPLHNRRAFLKGSAAAAASAVIGDRLARYSAAPPPPQSTPNLGQAPDDGQPLYLVSLAQWSLHRAFKSKRLDPLDFAVIAQRDHAIDAVEYVNQFYMGETSDAECLRQLKQRAADHGVRNVLIMCDGEGRLGDPDDAKRTAAIDNHRKWLDWAKELGCHSIRVNADSTGARAEQQRLAVDGLTRLTHMARAMDLNVIVENHGGLSSDGAWLAGVIRAVNLPQCGTLPDFGNFGNHDRYQGVSELMPLAKAVSAKSYDFDERGNEKTIDYARMLKIIVDAGYRKHVGIEYEGERLSEADGIRATKLLLERLRDELAVATG